MARTKPSKYVTLGVIIIALGVFGLYFLNKNDTQDKIVGLDQPQKEEKPEPIEKMVDKSLATDKFYKQPNQYAVFNVAYPQFQDASLEFNKKIESVVISGIEGHKKDAEANWQARYETRSPGEKIPEFPSASEKYPFSVSWEATQINPKFISILLIISGDTGGAHGYQNMLSFNFDVLKQEEIELADLFPNDPNYLKTVSDFSVKDLSSQFRRRLNIKTQQDEQNFKEVTIPMIVAGTKPETENFSIFTFTPKTITLYFAQYQVAPYSMGESKVVITRK